MQKLPLQEGRFISGFRLASPALPDDGKRTRLEPTRRVSLQKAISGASDTLAVTFHLMSGLNKLWLKWR